jgi:hypothetical protein
VLVNTAAVVNELLDSERRVIMAATNNITAARPVRPARPGRGFTALELTATGSLPTAIQPPKPRLDRPPRR